MKREGSETNKLSMFPPEPFWFNSSSESIVTALWVLRSESVGATIAVICALRR
jgi:hypothetical protein